MSFTNNVGEFQQAANQWQKMMTDSWSQWTKNTVASDSFTTASGAYMDWTLSTQKMMTEMSGQIMETLDIPRRSDLARLSSQVQAVETRLLDQEESNDDIRELLMKLNAKLDKIAEVSSTGTASPLQAAVAPQNTEVHASPEKPSNGSKSKKSSKKNASKA